ncbi:hypothetical protein LWC33_16175 [Pseudonocardia sp. RS11V-5]|uniref:hypothetical protein n=1 Tax=Pseudonocardia terrae TaxID=2905831 RepID=UPI001E46E59C|nr:hypothetical protein [Pseudonocardia terrae]MCE3552988.1 hypothetical protein [Pseudonocardia terrae]
MEITLDEASDRYGLLQEDPYEKETVFLSVEVRPRDGERVVQLVLVNGQREPERGADPFWIFQPKLTVTAHTGDRPDVFVPVDDPAAGGQVGDDAEDLHLDLLYRHHLRFAVAQNVSVDARAVPRSRRADLLQTTWLPVSDVPSTVAGAAGSAVLAMDTLATADAAGLRAGLAPLPTAMRTGWTSRRLRSPGSRRTCSRARPPRWRPGGRPRSGSARASRC